MVLLDRLIVLSGYGLRIGPLLIFPLLTRFTTQLLLSLVLA